ncbi:MAG: Formylmethionine deformylase [uncultured Sulfurovum sp.]|uniref:Formylmethionine deformylase n=1 Tax=uncultured Sulfurovum sp. TaxID=269237 RepID=A0A6S6SDR9_9BACT|nr:MAG: Formylmethionine deformylase [uncultured Sulfurovum sp.]
MIQEIITYPAQTDFGFGGTVRHFDETLTQLLTDLKDTITANNLEGLSAYQISSPLTVMVVKKDNEFIEIINPTIFTKEGKLHPTESTAYFPNLTATTTRAQKIKVMYEDREGQQQFLTAEDDLAILIQRKMDYLLGSTFLARMSIEEKELFENKLTQNTNNITLESCPTNLVGDKLLKGIKYGVIGGVIALGTSFFLEGSALNLLKTLEYSLLAILLLATVTYFFYAQYEGKKYNHCTSCQIANVAAMTLIKTIHIIGLFLLIYFLL